MGRKKIGVPNQAQETFELRPFCYYCDKEFDCTKTLITHQRTKHFNCGECGLKFDTVTGLRVHMLNAYKKTMKEVPNAMPGRENPDIVVHGMEGLPKGMLEERNRKAKAERNEKDREQRAAEKRAAEARDDDRPPPPEAKRHQAAAAPPPPEEPQPPEQGSNMLYLPPPHSQPQAGSAAAGSVGATATSQGMPGLSPSVAKLLSGSEAARQGPPIVPGLMNFSVPPALNGLHPVALQVLAFAGGLPSKSAAPPPALALLGSALGPMALGATAPWAMGLPPMLPVGL